MDKYTHFVDFGRELNDTTGKAMQLLLNESITVLNVYMWLYSVCLLKV